MFEHVEVWAALASAAAACVAAMFTIWGLHIAKKSLRLSEEIAKTRQPQIALYLIDCFVHPLKNNGKRIFAFSISMSNRSDTDNAVALINLKLHYKRSNGTHGNLVLPHDASLADALEIAGLRPLNVPQSVGAHDTIAGWIFFKLLDAHIRDSDLEAYEITFVDSHGNANTLEPIILREIIDEKMVAQD